MQFNEREKKRSKSTVVSAIAGRYEIEEKVVKIGRPKSEKETKKRFSIVLLPSLYEDVQKIAFVERKSISEIISQCLDQYVKNKSDALIEYETIIKKNNN